MAGPDRRGSTGLDRRASLWSTSQMRYAAEEEEEDDDYDLDAAGISDGFRPGNATRDFSQTSQPMNNRARSITPPPRPSSASKPKGTDQFTLRRDGAMSHVERDLTGGFANAGPNRRSSTSTDIADFVRFDAPYQGASGPSFPYQMYPQESQLPRTMSVVTSSTAPATERSYRGPTGPTHPYGMYPQNIATDTESVLGGSSQPPPIPVGFTGTNNDYQRRLGPDGEEVADMIGPNGHTEQLPPYTQYPDEAYARKIRPAVQTNVSGAGGIGLATRNPEFSSQEDLNSPQSRESIHSMESNTPANTQAREATNTASGLSEKPKLKKWQQVAKRKVCGIVPVWSLLLAATTLVMFGIVLGVTLYALKPKHRGQPPYGEGVTNGEVESVVYRTLTTTFDAAPFSTPPAELPDLPTGIYALPITVPSAAQNSCFHRTEQSKAWSCSLPDSPLQIQVFETYDANPLASNEILLDYGNNSIGNCWPYGAQPPILVDPQPLSLVFDTQEPERGPAWFFQTTYEKLVVVEADLIQTPTDLGAEVDKRDEPLHYDPPIRGSGDSSRRAFAQEGDSPWFCYWNDTLIEAFLYVNLTSSEAVHSLQHSISAARTTTTTGFPTRTANPTFTTGFGATPGAIPYQGPSWPNHDRLLPYPKVLKLQERRIPRLSDSPPPYCIKQLVSDDGSARPVLNSTGQPIIVYIDETVPDDFSPILKRENGISYYNGNLNRRANKNCGCVWLAT